jgi:catechol 2,3-dioxygenase-like lactoylglutathione lyase family enzyme
LRTTVREASRAYHVTMIHLDWRPGRRYAGAVLRVGSIVIRVDDLARQTAFWTAALDYVPRDNEADDFVLLKPRHGVGPNVSLDRVRSAVHLPPRIHLDLYADDQAAEIERLVGLGATLVDAGETPQWRTGNGTRWVAMCDPEGNEFCLG